MDSLLVRAITSSRSTKISASMVVPSWVSARRQDRGSKGASALRGSIVSGYGSPGGTEVAKSSMDFPPVEDGPPPPQRSGRGPAPCAAPGRKNHGYPPRRGGDPGAGCRVFFVHPTHRLEVPDLRRDGSAGERYSAYKVQSVDQRMRLECGVGFRQLRTCRRTRPGSYVPQPLMHRSKHHPYSITSSARASSVGGIVEPSALAVCKVDDQDRTWSAARLEYRRASSRAKSYRPSRRRGGTMLESLVHRTSCLRHRAIARAEDRRQSRAQGKA